MNQKCPDCATEIPNLGENCVNQHCTFYQVPCRRIRQVLARQFKIEREQFCREAMLRLIAGGALSKMSPRELWAHARSAWETKPEDL